MKKKIYYILAVVCIILIIIILCFIGDKKLDLNSEEVSTLYKYLGEVDIYHCGGLNSYSDKTITKNDISKENKLCMAYYNLDESNIEVNTINSKETNENDIKTCKVGENLTFTANNEDTCEYSIISKDKLNASYKEIYGEEIDDFSKFYISSSNICESEGEEYYCGASESFTYSLTNQATIYRLMDKAIKKTNDDIVIYDYFLKISDNKCYSKNNLEENTTCTENLTEDIDAKFVQKYGSIYKHTFKKDSDGNYHFEQTELS